VPTGSALETLYADAHPAGDCLTCASFQGGAGGIRPMIADERLDRDPELAVHADSVIGGADVHGRDADGARCRSRANDRWMVGTSSLDAKLQPAACATAPSMIR
jgi:hypothetical protein